MAGRHSAVVVLLALARLPTVVRGLASCCVNSTSGVDFVDDCTCLVDNTQLSGQVLAAGQTKIYHWVLSLDNSELVSGSVRGNLTFEVRQTLLPTTARPYVVGVVTALLQKCGRTSRDCFFMREREGERLISPHLASAPEPTLRGMLQ